MANETIQLTPDDKHSLLETSSQHLKDLRIAVEFKSLSKQGPGGVYLMPHLDDIRQFYGVIFVRRGLYKNGIFRFKMTLPSNYNSLGSTPQIIFTPPIFNPLVHPKTGALSLVSDENLREWNSKKLILNSALVFLKKIFYMRSFNDYEFVANEEARQLFVQDKEEYMKRVAACVSYSLSHIYDSPGPECSLIFTEPKQVHETLRSQIYSAASERELKSQVVNETLATPVSKTAVSLYPASSPKKEHYLNEDSFHQDQEENISVSRALDLERTDIE